MQHLVRGIMAVESFRRLPRRHPGINGNGIIQDASQEAARKHPGAPRRHPKRQPRRHPRRPRSTTRGIK